MPRARALLAAAGYLGRAAMKIRHIVGFPALAAAYYGFRFVALERQALAPTSRAGGGGRWPWGAISSNGCSPSGSPCSA